MAEPGMGQHADHDPLLVAALADRELTGQKHDRARTQVAACPECATLHTDLVSLARATHDLPPIARPRDFTLRPEDAQRYRPGLVRRLVGAFGTARDGFSRPLAMGLTTLGLAGLLIGIVPGALSSGGTTALSPVGEAATDQAIRSAVPLPAAAPGASGSDNGNFQENGGSGPQIAGETVEPITITDSDRLGRDSLAMQFPLVLVSIVVLAAGLALGAARLLVRRRRGNHPANRLV